VKLLVEVVALEVLEVQEFLTPQAPEVLAAQDYAQPLLDSVFFMLVAEQVIVKIVS
jgi:hypothetical protein